MTGSEERDRWAELKVWAEDARARSATYAAQAARAAESATAIGEHVDRMIERVAERNPEYADYLLAIIVTAFCRRSAIAEYKRSCAARRPGSQLLPRPRNQPEAAAITELEGHHRGTAIFQERDQAAGELHDQVVQRVFAAGLTLQDTVELITEPEVRWRIEAAADDLDELIRVIRGTLFSPADRSPSHEPGSGPEDATSPAGD